MLEVKDTYWHSKVSYLDLHLETDNRGRLKTQLYDKRDELTFPIPVVNFLSPVTIFQQHQHTEFTFHNSYVILELEPSTVIFRTELSCLRKSCSNKTMLFIAWSHRYTNYTVVITIWSTVTKYVYLKWQWNFSFHVYFFFRLSPIRLYFYRILLL